MPRQHVEAALCDPEQNLRLFIEGVRDYAILMLDPDGNVVTWNAGAKAIEGYDAGEIIGRHFSVFYPPEDVAAGKPQQALAKAREACRFSDLGEQVRKDGSRFLADVAITPVFSPGGQLLGYGKITRDVGARAAAEDPTARGQAEDELRQSQRMEAVAQLAGGIAHDFNNIMMVVMANADALLEETVSPAIRQRVEQISSATDRAAELTRQLLAFSRKQPLRPRPTNLNELVTATGELLRRTLGADVEIRSSLASDLWTIDVDRAQLESALVNLALNARDAMPGGGRLLIETGNQSFDADPAAQRADAAEGAHVMLSISDTGIGIPPETLSRVFEPFFTTKGVGKGTGLGLSMVHGFIKQSNGHIRIYSEVGRGTTVRLYLPCARKGAAGTASRAEAGPMPPGQERIPVVKDDP